MLFFCPKPIIQWSSVTGYIFISDDGRGSVSGEPTGDPSRPRRKVGETEKCRIVLQSEGIKRADRGSHCVVSLTKTLYLLLSTGSTQEDRKLSWHDWKIVDWDAGVTAYVITWMLQAHSMAPSLIYTVNFSLCKNYTNKCLSKLSSAGVPNIPLGRNI